MITKNTVSIPEILPETNLAKMHGFPQGTAGRECELAHEAVGRLLKPMALEDFMRDIELSERQISNGECKSAKEFFYELEQKYGI